MRKMTKVDIVLFFHSTLKQYLETWEDFLKKELKKFETEIKETVPKNEEEELYLDYLESELGRQLSYDFPSIHRNSFLVSCCSYLEEQLYYFCEDLRDKHNLPLKVSDLKGNALERVKKYFTKLGKIDIPANWEEILSISDIRNCIVHNEGRIDSGNQKKDRKIQDYIDRRSDIKYDKDKKIILDKEYCVHVLDSIRTLFEAFYSNSRRPSA